MGSCRCNHSPFAAKTPLGERLRLQLPASVGERCGRWVSDCICNYLCILNLKVSDVVDVVVFHKKFFCFNTGRQADNKIQETSRTDQVDRDEQD